MAKLPNLTPTEDHEQILLVNWLEKMGILHTASANGGKRDLLVAMKLKRMGVKSGFPDVFVPHPIGVYHGLFIELKRKKGGFLSDNQKWWLDALRQKGYYAEVAHGFDEAKEMVQHYLSLNKKGT